MACRKKLIEFRGNTGRLCVTWLVDTDWDLGDWGLELSCDWAFLQGLGRWCIGSLCSPYGIGLCFEHAIQLVS
jgi:hypothetical protein